jgi:hypothetical protein
MLVVLSFVLGTYRIEAEDIFSNIVTGAYLWHTKTLPHSDPFSYTGPHPWLNNRPLPCLIFFLAHSFGGLVAIQLLSTGLCCLAYCLLYLAWSTRLQNPRLVLGVAILCILASCYWFQPRIYVFGFVYTAISLVLITSINKKLLLWCIPLQVLWINSHPSAILGIFLVSVWVLQSSVQEKGLSTYSLFIFVGVVLSNLLSPNGWTNFKKFYEEIFVEHPSRTNIFEWFSPFHEQMVGHPLSWWFFAACVLFALLALKSTGSMGKDLCTQATILSTAALAALAAGCSRHIPFFYLALFGSLATMIDHHLRRGLWSTLSRHHVSALILYSVTPLVACKVAVAGYSNGTSRRYLEFGIDRHKFAEGPIKILKDRKVGGNVFCDYDNGAYFLYRMYPDYKVYIDGARLDEVYGEAGFERYMRIGNDLDALKEEIRRYDIRSFIIPLPQIASEIVVPHRFLSTSPDWVLAYFDDVTMLYVRRDEASRVGIPSYSFINPFLSITEVLKSSADAVTGLERDFKQGEIINPNSIVFLVLRLRFLKAQHNTEQFKAVFETVVRACRVRDASPACSRFFFNQTW